MSARAGGAGWGGINFSHRVPKTSSESESCEIKNYPSVDAKLAHERLPTLDGAAFFFAGTAFCCKGRASGPTVCWGVCTVCVRFREYRVKSLTVVAREEVGFLSRWGMRVYESRVFVSATCACVCVRMCTYPYLVGSAGLVVVREGLESALGGFSACVCVQGS